MGNRNGNGYGDGSWSQLGAGYGQGDIEGNGMSLEARYGEVERVEQIADDETQQRHQRVQHGGGEADFL